jgi:hypothetical protein
MSLSDRRFSQYGNHLCIRGLQDSRQQLCLNRLPVQLGEGVLFAEDKDLALVSKVTLYKVLVYEACHDALHLIAR